MRTLCPLQARAPPVEAPDAQAVPDWGDACDPWVASPACILGPLDSLLGGLLPGFFRPTPEQPNVESKAN